MIDLGFINLRLGDFFYLNRIKIIYEENLALSNK